MICFLIPRYAKKTGMRTRGISQRKVSCNPIGNRMQRANVMGRSSRIFSQAFFPVILILFVAGCSLVNRSRIVLDFMGTREDGTAVANFTVDEVDSFVRSFALQKGYEIKFADASDVWAQEETGDGESSLLWIAEKPDGPIMLFISSDKALTVTLIQASGPSWSPVMKEYTNVIYRMLADKFGEENVHMDD